MPYFPEFKLDCGFYTFIELSPLRPLQNKVFD